MEIPSETMGMHPWRAISDMRSDGHIIRGIGARAWMVVVILVAFLVVTSSFSVAFSECEGRSTVQSISVEPSSSEDMMRSGGASYRPVIDHMVLLIAVSFNASDNAGVASVTVKFRDTGELLTAIDMDCDGTYQVNFSTTKDELADGFSVNVSVTDVNGYNVIRVEEGDFQTGWEKLWETVSDWLSAALTYVREVAAAFLTMLVGPVVAGAILGLIEGFAKAMFDDLTFIAQIPGMLADLKGLADGLWAMIKNPMGMLVELVNQTIQKAAKVAPYSGTVIVSQVSGIVTRFFMGAWDEIHESDLALYCAAYTVMSVIGVIIWMCISGNVFSKIGKWVKGTQLAQDAGDGFTAIRNFAGKASGSISKSDDVARTSSRAAKEGRILEEGMTRGAAKATTKQLDNAAEDAGKIGERVAREVTGEAEDAAVGCAKLTEKFGDKFLKKIANKDEIGRYAAAMKNGKLLDENALYAIDKIVTKYGKESDAFNNIMTIARNSEKITEGSGLNALIKTWGNSLGKKADGIAGYEAEIEKISKMIDAQSTKNIIIGGKSSVFHNDRTRSVELDIQIKDGVVSNAYEIKGGDYVSLTRGERGTMDQIDRQVIWRNKGPSTRTLTWQFKGKPSQPLLDYLKTNNISVIDWRGNPL
jgi:hypothetical protein